MRFAETLEPDSQYRIFSVHDPARARTLVSSAPVTAAEWWIAGEYALTVEHRPEAASSAFSKAIASEPTNGDYYASRARAEAAIDPNAASRDLNIAQLLGVLYEYPNAVRAQLSSTSAEREMFLANALPPRLVLQEFAAVMYGRSVALFDVFPEMQRIGPGRDAMQPWYEIAGALIEVDDLEGARRVYRAILDYAPDEVEARELLNSLP